MFKSTKLVALTAACMLAFGCSSGDGDKTADEAKDAGAADGGSSSSGADGASSSSGADGASSSGGADGASSSSGADATSSSSGADTGKEPIHKTCPALGDCVLKECGAKGFATDCEKACVADADTAALGKGVPLLGCVQEKCVKVECKGETDPAKKGECINKCMSGTCGEFILPCMDDGKAGAKTCGTAFDCFDGCDTDKTKPMFACWAACFNDLDADSKKSFGGMMDCAAKNGGFEGQDFEIKCGKQAILCQIGGKWGDAKCADTLGCMSACPENKNDEKVGEDCRNKCMGAASEAGFDALMSLNGGHCFGDESGETPDPKCSDWFLGCINPTGKASCGETHKCVAKCAADAITGGKKQEELGLSCHLKCLPDAEKQAAADYWGLGMACKGGDDKPAPPPGGATPVDAGPSPMCIDAVIKCSGTAATGGTDCVGLGACADACNKANSGADGLGCGMECAAKASAAGAADFKTMVECQAKFAEKCNKESDPKGCSDKEWAADKDCAAIAQKCAPPKK